ncbi:MAG: SDR family NAD(P)-dependent oxidoreductase [Trueperaceae bacterium]
MSFEYANKTALITGASSGIGYAFALELAKRGCQLILVARSRDKLESLAEMLKQNHGANVQVIVQDLSVEGAAQVVFAQVQHANKHVHLLINNAGFGADGQFEKTSFETQHAMTLLNVTALSDLTHLFLPAMLGRGSGGIINVASIISFSPFPYMSIYAATKAFVLSFTQGLWVENRKRGVHILALCPGNTATGFFANMGVPEKEVGKMDSPEDVVKQALKALEKNRSYVITNVGFKIMARVVRFIPRELWLRLMGRLNA